MKVQSAIAIAIAILAIAPKAAQAATIQQLRKSVVYAEKEVKRGLKANHSQAQANSFCYSLGYIQAGSQPVLPRTIKDTRQCYRMFARGESDRIMGITDR